MNIWVKMAQLEFPDGPMHVLMARANKLFKKNGSAFETAPFSKVEIGFSELLDTIKSQKNQREIDLVYATNAYHRAWTSLHVGMGTLKEILNPSDEDEVRNVYAALERLGMSHLMTNGLNKKCNRWLIDG